MTYKFNYGKKLPETFRPIARGQKKIQAKTLQNKNKRLL